MSQFDADLAAVMRDVATTVPVQYGATAVRGFLDHAVRVGRRGGEELDLAATVLQLTKADAATLVTDTPITVGAVGAASAVGGAVYTIDALLPADDGALINVVLIDGADA